MFQELKQKRFCLPVTTSGQYRSFADSFGQPDSWLEVDLPKMNSDKWEAPFRLHQTSARGDIACVSCGKRRVFFSKSRLLSKERPLFQCGIENIEFQCGEPLFPEDFGVVSPDHTDFDKQKDFFERFVVNQNLSYDSPVETILYKTTKHIICRICGVDLSENQGILDDIERLSTKFYTVIPTCKSEECGEFYCKRPKKRAAGKRRLKPKKKARVDNTFEPDPTHQ